MTERVEVKEKVLSENDRLAADLRRQLRDRRVFALNLVSSPGSGKTSLLERTLAEFNDTIRIAVVAGDVQTENDANRLKAAGGRIVRPIVTGGLCHLDARMVTKAVAEIDLAALDLLVVENVGNLVCPSSYDLGEDMKVVVISTTEGDDKPLKYPGMFRRSSVMVVNKIDLLGSSDFTLAKVKENALSINGNLKIFEVSCRTGEGLDKWYQWLRDQVAASKASP
ncbi:MAG TPA: hydrogenase nickel incorporation protein HypB [candidate division Zixibacteria bacterium]|nr:hydrogenase nickel incorporation protein HypB [candidate division Zixibacteria bacterium]MDD4917736.1 hydrogenase nickel incorporation protein HypB [candidate division Zixibacteria bacterium]MDM7972801.1 hydrogenase nickel incorporation protein HypB [candidate division Zixibacteria bacterium]HOD66299.1 hydrogenase nickel incorporation protein HypB [candidate division Zixibacteria bacterium]HOZ06744.1 hydrogenase nickel incorporation protein HypB [candidate division Zixibacteria bacterium]